MPALAFVVFTLFLYTCVYTAVKCDSTCSNMLECTMYNIQQVSSKVDGIQSNMADIVNQLTQIQEILTQKEKEELSGYVSFTAFATVPRKYNQGDHVMFDAIVRNYGAAYFENVSEFICPVNAYYMISISLLADRGKGMNADIMLEDEELVLACAYDETDHGSSSQTVVTYCEAGQRIWVKCNFDYNNYNTWMFGRSTRAFSTFGATLLRVA